jgi:hypothetical protein
VFPCLLRGFLFFWVEKNPALFEQYQGSLQHHLHLFSSVFQFFK